MKKIMFKVLGLGLLVLFSVSLSQQTVFAQDNVEDIVEKQFEKSDDEDSILALPNGGFLHGEANIYSMDNPNEVIATIDTDNDTNAITVAEAKEIAEDIVKKGTQTALLNPTGINPLSRRKTPATNVWELKGRESYFSQSFSGRGWVFAGYFFRPAPNTGGPYLKWHTYVDSGVVGGLNHANYTYRTGNINGTIIYPNSPKYVSGSYTETTYFTKDPLPGTFYLVANY